MSEVGCPPATMLHVVSPSAHDERKAAGLADLMPATLLLFPGHRSALELDGSGLIANVRVDSGAPLRVRVTIAVKLGPREGVAVKLSDDAHPVGRLVAARAGLTDDDLVFSSVPPGRYTLEVQCGGEQRSFRIPLEIVPVR